jgi:uncharacterized protein (TIGR00304 family)
VVDAGTLYASGIALILIGVLIIIVAIVLISVSSAKGEGEVRGGGVVMIGPIPIIFGTDKKSLKTAVLLSLALAVLAVWVRRLCLRASMSSREGLLKRESKPIVGFSVY